MRKSFLLPAALAVACFACGGAMEIQLKPEFRPNNQPVALLSSITATFQAKASGGGLLGAAVASGKESKLRNAVTNIAPLATMKNVAVSTLADFKIAYAVSPLADKASLEAPMLDDVADTAIDRNFARIREQIKADLVLEFRITEFRVKQNDGLGGDYNVIVTVEGIMHDLKSGQKVWQDSDDEELEIDGYSLDDIVKDKAAVFQQHFENALKTVTKKLVNRLLSKEN